MEEIGKILSKVLEPQFSRTEPPVIEVLAPLWARVAGQALAKECRPVAFSLGTLTLVTDDPAWAEPLQQMAEEIRVHVNIFLGKPVVKHLRIINFRKIGAGGRLRPPPGETSLSSAKSNDYPGRNPAASSSATGVLARSRANYSGRRLGKVQ